MTSAKRLQLLTNNLVNNNTRYDHKDLIVQYYPNFCKIILNRPQTANVIKEAMRESFFLNRQNIEKRKCFWIQGAGNKFFCAGGDIIGDSPYNYDFDKKSKYEESHLKFIHMMNKIKSVGIAHWNGAVMGGGIGISGTVPFRIATEKTIFAYPQVKFGFYPNSAGGYILPRLKGNIGCYLAMTGERLIGQEVYIAGAANYFIPSVKIEAVYQQIKQAIQTSSLTVVQIIKSVLDKYHQQPKINKIKHEDRINYIFGGKTIEDILYRIDAKISDNFHYKIKRILDSLSPLAVVLSFQHLQMCQKLSSFKQVIRLQYRVTCHRMVESDIALGITKRIIQKSDQKIKWSHDHFLDVKRQEIDQYYKPIKKQLVFDDD